MPNQMPEERQPIPLDAIRRIQRECMAVDDENRWLLALISDTGMRLSEAAGLHRDDIVLDADIPHINVRPHMRTNVDVGYVCIQHDVVSMQSCSL